MATQMQLEVILAGNRIATLSCEAKTTKESIKTKTESGHCFCILVVLSIKLRLIASCPQIWNIAGERKIQRKREYRWQASEAQREKDRQRARARDKTKRRFLLEEQHKNFVAAVRNWEMLVATKVNISGREKKIVNKKQVRHFLHKTFSQEVSGSFMLFSCKTTGKKSTKQVSCTCKVAFLLIRPSFFFFAILGVSFAT